MWKIVFDFEEAVVFGHAVGAGERACFDLTGRCRNGEVCDRCIFRFAGSWEMTMPKPALRAIAMVLRVSVRVPIWFGLDEDGAGCFLCDPFF